MLRGHDVGELLLARRKAMTRLPELWQLDLLSADAFRAFASKRGIEVFQSETIERLWQVGLLRAEIVRSDYALNMHGLELVAEDCGELVYLDARRIPFRESGYGGSLQNIGPHICGVELLFHPFRVYVLHHIDRIFGSHGSSTQYLLYPEGAKSVAQREIDHLNRWTSSDEFVSRFEDWNRTAEFAIVMEPIAYERLFGVVRCRHPETETTMREKLAAARASMVPLLTSVTALQIDEVRRALCTDAESVDQNKLVHVLLRLMSAHERLNLRDALGKAMLFLTMAEVLRRAFESVHGVELREEDEMGFGQWMDGARRTIYGSERILDSSREVKRDFLTRMGLDCGTKVRCYVEGYTELGALTSAVGESGGTQFVNLSGQVLERHGQGLKFVESLTTDRQSHVFSVVLIDADKSDNVRALKKAAKEGRFFGRFFISKPDFEFANFSISELIDAAVEVSGRQATEALDVRAVEAATVQSRSGKEFLTALNNIGFARIEKSEMWGIALMDRALKDPLLPKGHERAGAPRPIVQVAQLLLNARGAGYVRSIEHLTVDYETGELRARST